MRFWYEYSIVFVSDTPFPLLGYPTMIIGSYRYYTQDEFYHMALSHKPGPWIPYCTAVRRFNKSDGWVDLHPHYVTLPKMGDI